VLTGSSEKDAFTSSSGGMDEVSHFSNQNAGYSRDCTVLSSSREDCMNDGNLLEGI
jgi:hypothetical protein